MDLNEMYDLILGPVDRTPPPPSLEAIAGWVEQHRDMQDKHYKFHVLDAALENLEEIRRMP